MTSGGRVDVQREHKQRLTTCRTQCNLDAGATDSGDVVTAVAGEFEWRGGVGGGAAKEFRSGLCQSFADCGHWNRAMGKVKFGNCVRQKLPV